MLYSLKHTLKQNPENRERMAQLQAERRDFNPRIANEELLRLIKEDALNDQKAKKKKKKAVEKVDIENQAGEDDVMFGDLFSSQPDGSGASSASKTLSKAIPVRDFSYSSWTGKSPTQYLRVCGALFRLIFGRIGLLKLPRINASSRQR